MAVTIADLRARVETDLEDTTLQRILDGAVESIDRVAGKEAEATENHQARNASELSVVRPCATVTSITERRRVSSAPVVLAADDYLQVGEYRFIRLGTGTNPASIWGDLVELVYVPDTDPETRDRAALDVAQIDIEFRAYDREKSGDWEGEQKDWKARRREVLAQVREGNSPLV